MITYFVFLVEDASGKALLGELIPKILDSKKQTSKFHLYKGLGHIPKGMKGKTDVKARILLDRLPQLLQGFGKTLRYSNAVVVVVVDLDKRKESDFRKKLQNVLENCNPAPKALFCIAIEEMEAWLLGDIKAIYQAYPKVKVKILKRYKQDSICGTWELLADAIYPGGSQELKKKNAGKEKYKWAQKIGKHMQIGRNKSMSFQAFIKSIKDLC